MTTFDVPGVVSLRQFEQFATRRCPNLEVIRICSSHFRSYSRSEEAVRVLLCFITIYPSASSGVLFEDMSPGYARILSEIPSESKSRRVLTKLHP